jgi:N-acetylglucosamine kinase-like BadF-type ATPase
MNRDPLVRLPPALAPSPVAGEGSSPRSQQSSPSAPASEQAAGRAARPPARAGGRVGFIMGIDGGGTKTLAAVLDLERGELHLGHGGPSNQDAVGARAATKALLDSADEAIKRAGATRDGLHAAVLAVAGTDTDAVEAHVRASCPAGWIVVNDVIGAWATATGAQPGVGAISGTGSNVFGVGPDARTWRAGGWGHVLGDEGSGYWLGLQSIKAALRDRDGSGSKTALSDAAVEFFAVPDIETLAPLVYSKPLTKSEIAAFAIETARIAERGDAVARALFEDGARELAVLIEAVVRNTGLSGAFPVGLIGSAYKAGEIFVEPLTRAIHDLAPEAQVSLVEMAPVGGCLLLAARVCGIDRALDRGELERLIDAGLAVPQR